MRERESDFSILLSPVFWCHDGIDYGAEGPGAYELLQCVKSQARLERVGSRLLLPAHTPTTQLPAPHRLFRAATWRSTRTSMARSRSSLSNHVDVAFNATDDDDRDRDNHGDNVERMCGRENLDVRIRGTAHGAPRHEHKKMRLRQGLRASGNTVHL